MAEVTVRAANPSVLLDYLACLGLLRVVSEQIDRSATGRWSDEGFHLVSPMDSSELRGFLLDRYEPSPIAAPWNKDFRGGGPVAAAILGSSAARFDSIRSVLSILSESEVAELVEEVRESSGKEGAEKKRRLINLLRSRAPDRYVEWLDAVYPAGPARPTPGPLFVSGGNDGRAEFSRWFLDHLASVLPDLGGDRRRSERWLDALLSGTETSLVRDGKVGLFSPGRAGGLNATMGVEGEGMVNPWGYVLAIEGSLAFAGGLTRLDKASDQGGAATPFTVTPVAAGAGLAEGESLRSEVWLPVWTRPATWTDLAELFVEGRARLRRRPAVDSRDFAVAVSALGVARGVAAFERVMIAQRFGRSHFAVPLGRFRVGAGGRWASLLEEAADQVRRIRRGDTPRRLASAARRADDALYAAAAHPSRRNLEDLLIRLGELELALAGTPSSRAGVRPIRLRSAWHMLDDGSSEWALASALTGLGFGEGRWSLRWWFEPVSDRLDRFEDRTPRVPWSGPLEDRLIELLLARIQAAQQDDDQPSNRSRRLALSGAVTVRPGDIEAFLRRECDDARISALAAALSLRESPGNSIERPQKEGLLPIGYRLLKLCLLGRAPDPDRPIPIDPRLVRLLAAGRGAEALTHAARRLRGYGYPPVVTTAPVADPRRLAASLVFPIETRHLMPAIHEPHSEHRSAPLEQGGTR